ncbi:hypothetical protein Agabi119p4_7054 [Agaricus bisporus var. burnettii]|uniref:RNA-directed DNA polymerase n=1 Tax=Agaricus bisporus var. burnettii TaxID=192524 RepID=A0A8H7KG11_AGABI|nr:hypothetical protein Agabi119p4_7054 [Agaricus bisporus var. burnettii]
MHTAYTVASQRPSKPKGPGPLSGPNSLLPTLEVIPTSSPASSSRDHTDTALLRSRKLVPKSTVPIHNDHSQVPQSVVEPQLNVHEVIDHEDLDSSDDQLLLASLPQSPAPTTSQQLTLSANLPLTTASSPDTESDSESDSDSSSDFDMGKSPITISAGIELSKVGGLPRVTATTLTPSILRDLEDYANVCYQVGRKVAPAKQLKKLAACFSNIEHMSWVLTEADLQPEGTTLSAFLDKMRKRFLPNNWELLIEAKREAEIMHEDDTYMDWATRIKKKNNILKGTPCHLNDKCLRLFLLSHLEHGLKGIVFSATDDKGTKVTDIKEFSHWEQEVQRLDTLRASQRASQRQLVLSMMNDNDRHRDSKPGKSKGKKQSDGKISSDRCPPLTGDERTILYKYDGCLKCRKVFQDHISKDCTAAWPKKDGYRAVQEPPQSDIDAWKKKPSGSRDKRSRSDHASHASSSHPSKRAKKDVAAAILESESDSSEADDVIAAIEDDGDTTDEVRGRHLYWDCSLTGPNSESPVNTTALLDSGAHVVLIRDTLVSELGLKRFPLSDTFSVRGAMSTHRSFINEYVYIVLSSCDMSYTARPVRALIIGELSAPIILGMPFLSRNAIQINHHTRVVTDTLQNVNLLGSGSTTHTKPIKRDTDAHPNPKHKKRNTQLTTAPYRKLLVESLKDKLRTTKMTLSPHQHTSSSDAHEVVAAIHKRITQVIDEEVLRRLHAKIVSEFASVFSAMPKVSCLPKDIEADIRLKDPQLTVKPRTYSCPRRYKEAWKKLIDDHLEAGRIQPSASPFASPSFCIPKSDPSAPPRWVNDYRELNKNTVPDNYALPKVDDVLNDCAKGKYFAVIDMTNAFFQTRMRAKDIHKTAVTTPFGSFEWKVMPMGLRNAPAIHQRRINKALRAHIGKICQAYIDDIVIWSHTLSEHETNVRLILSTLQQAGLYCNLKKTKLFCTEINFLGHHISSDGIRADDRKAEKIVNWPIPQNAKDVRQFLGLVRYVAVFLPDLARYSTILNKLTDKSSVTDFPDWNDSHQHAFDKIKELVLSRDCLTTIDYTAMPLKRVFVSTDASDFASGAVLSFGETFETAQPVAFESKSFKGAELNYPVHEKELFAIVRALEKWRVDLLGVPFTVLTDHRTLECFNTQRHLSRRQARWMEFLQQYDFSIVYLRGEDNVAADALSRTTFTNAISEQDAFHMSPCDRLDELDISVCATLDNALTPQAEWAAMLSLLPNDTIAHTLDIAADDELRDSILAGYTNDTWCTKLLATWQQMHNVVLRGGLLFFEDRLIIPRTGNVRETIFALAHDSLGHFGLDKSYEALRGSFYWPGMHTDLEKLYVPKCAQCQRMKSSTKKPIGPLHPLPIPDHRFQAVAIDFVGPLPEELGFNCIFTMTDRLGADVRLVPTTMNATAVDTAQLFFHHWYCENGLPQEIVSDRDKLFTSSFWRSLHELTGTALKMSTSFHPQTDGASERTNKTLNQCLRMHVDSMQRGWVKALPAIRFAMMNTQNASTGLTGFQLRMGCSPRVIPPIYRDNSDLPTESPEDFLFRVSSLEAQARDTLLQHKVLQAHQANKHRDTSPFPFVVGGRVKLSTANRRKKLSVEGAKRVAKLMPRFEGPYVIRAVNEENSTVTLEIPRRGHPNGTESFHTSLVRQWVEDDAQVFDRPPLNDAGEAEVEEIVERRKIGRGWSYRVKYRGYPKEENQWLPGREVENLEALDRFFAREGLTELGQTVSLSSG